MDKLNSFDNLTKSQEELLNNNYCFGNLALLKLNIAKENFTFHSRISQAKDQNTLASTWIKLGNEWVTFKHKRSTEKFSQYKLEFLLKDYIKQNLKVICDCQLWGISAHKDPSVSVEYSNEKMTGKMVYHTDNNEIHLQLTGGKPEYGVGLDCKYEFSTKSLQHFIVAGWWTESNRTLALKLMLNSLNTTKVNISYYQELNPNARLASFVSTNLSNAVTKIKVGGDYKLDQDTVIKAKINSTGNVGLAFSRKLSSTLSATLATEINTKSLVSHADNDYRLGFRVDFNS